jgi:hypothetical protein
MLKLTMLKRSMLAALVAGLALGAQSAVADNLTFYEGHGWLAQPPFDSRPATVLVAGGGGDDSAFPYAATERQSPPWNDFVPDSQRRVTLIRSASPGVTMPAPYKTPGGYFN